MDKDCLNYLQKIFSNLNSLCNKFLNNYNIDNVDNILEIIEKDDTYINEIFKNIEEQIIKCQHLENKKINKTISILSDSSNKINESIEELTESFQKEIYKIESIDNLGDIKKIKEELKTTINDFIDFTYKIKKDIKNVEYILQNEFQKITNAAKEIESLREEIYRDELTGLYNKKGLESIYQTIINNSEPLSLLFIDIDKFKDVNDTYGHLAGDLILKTFADILQNSVRAEDIVARIYGDEFIIIFNGLKVGVASNIAERIRERIERATFYYKNTPIKITISGGLIPVDKNKTFNETIEVADKLLYIAKKSNNKIVSV